ncbi:hypothetical protein THOM_0591 [Trachipleistophora hominis]|uniref:Uncharacterized protein n=1 Tax=Trachipleistophora hominis TaxID=72359 RepID=L7JY93_TRAHO|nr:hypothetical protein THOM_0591 [Trachipleistophora hominis]
MLSSLQQEINNLLYIYFNAIGLLQSKEEVDLSFLLDELQSCKERIEKLLDLEEAEDVEIDIREDLEDAQAFFEFFLKN